MGISKRNIRGVQDIRTLSGRVDQVAVPFMAYMRISCLEMEKARRSKERQSAMHRVNTIDTRFKDIEAEKASLLVALGEHKGDNSPNAQANDSKAGPRNSKGGFKYRY